MLFVPLVNSDNRHFHHQATLIGGGGNGIEEDSLSCSDRSPFWTSQSLAMLSSAIISTSLAPNQHDDPVGEVEQWRMLSADKQVYFLHDADFEKFNVVRLSRMKADSASGRSIAASGRNAGSTGEVFCYYLLSYF